MTFFADMVTPLVASGHRASTVARARNLVRDKAVGREQAAIATALLPAWVRVLGTPLAMHLQAPPLNQRN